MNNDSINKSDATTSDPSNQLGKQFEDLLNQYVYLLTNPKNPCCQVGDRIRPKHLEAVKKNLVEVAGRITPEEKPLALFRVSLPSKACILFTDRAIYWRNGWANTSSQKDLTKELQHAPAEMIAGGKLSTQVSKLLSRKVFSLSYEDIRYIKLGRRRFFADHFIYVNHETIALPLQCYIGVSYMLSCLQHVLGLPPIVPLENIREDFEKGKVQETGCWIVAAIIGIVALVLLVWLLRY